MPTLPSKLIDCPRCGNVNRVSGWDGRDDWSCQNCGLVLLRAGSLEPAPVPPSSVFGQSQPLPDIRRKLKPWIDIHHLPTPDELESAEVEAKSPGWMSRPAIPQPSAKRDLPPGSMRSPPSPPPSVEPIAEEGRALTTGNVDTEILSWSLEDADLAQPEETPARTTAGKANGSASRSPGVVAMFGSLVLLALVGWLVYSVWNSRDRQTQASPGAFAPSAQTHWREEFLPLARRFANAATADEWIPMIRDADRVAPMVRVFKPRFASGRPMGVAAFGSEAFGEEELYQFAVVYEDGRSRLIHIVPTADGPKVDWESFARAGETDFAGLRAVTSVEAEVRVLVRRARYYNYNFADDHRWRAFEISNGDWPETFTGYAETGSTVEQALLDMIPPEESAIPVRLILKVRGGGEDGARGQLEILQLVQQGWVKP